MQSNRIKYQQIPAIQPNKEIPIIIGSKIDSRYLIRRREHLDSRGLLRFQIDLSNEWSALFSINTLTNYQSFLEHDLSVVVEVVDFPV